MKTRKILVALVTILMVGNMAVISNAATVYPEGTDTFSSAMWDLEIEFFTNPYNIPVGTVAIPHLQGPTTVERWLWPVADNDYDNDGLGDIQTEIVALSLSGNSPFGTVNVHQSSTYRSLGAVEEQAADKGFPYPANSFFDVFLDIELPGGLTIFNMDPIRMQSVINSFPPAVGTLYEVDPTAPWWPVVADTEPLPIDLFAYTGVDSEYIRIGQLVGHPHHEIVPLPTAVWAGFAMLGGMGLINIGRRLRAQTR